MRATPSKPHICSSGPGKPSSTPAQGSPGELERAAGMFERLGDVRQAADAEAFWAAWLVNHNNAGEALVHAKRRRLCSKISRSSEGRRTRSWRSAGLDQRSTIPNAGSHWPPVLRSRSGSDPRSALLTLARERLCRDETRRSPRGRGGATPARGHVEYRRTLQDVRSGGSLALGRIDESRTWTRVLRTPLAAARDHPGQGLEAQLVSLAFTAGDWNATRPITEAARARAQLGADSGKPTTLGDEVAIAIRAVVDLSDGRMSDGVSERTAGREPRRSGISGRSGERACHLHLRPHACWRIRRGLTAN